MDPINALRLGQILQQEIVDQCLNDQLGYEIEQRPHSFWQRAISLLSALSARSSDARTHQTAVSMDCDNLAASR